MIEEVTLEPGYAHYVAKDEANAPYFAIIIPTLRDREEAEYDNLYAAPTQTFEWHTLRFLNSDQGERTLRFVDPHNAEWLTGSLGSSENFFFSGHTLFVYVDGAGRAEYYLNQARPVHGVLPSPLVIESQSLPQEVRDIEFHGLSQDGTQRLVVMRSRFYRYDVRLHRAYYGKSSAPVLPEIAFQQSLEFRYDPEANTFSHAMASGQEMVLFLASEDCFSATLDGMAFALAPSEGITFEENQGALHLKRV